MNPNMDIDYILASYKDDEPETQTEPGASEPAPETQTATAGDGGHPEQAAGAEPAKQEPAKADGPQNDANAPAGQQAAGAEPDKDNNGGEPANGDGGVAGTEGNAGAASEPAKAKPKVPRRNPLSRLEKAEYSTRKWKQKYREMREKRDALQAELEKYSRIDPTQFRDPADRERFLAWQARTEQKLNGMDEDLEDIANRQYEREYESKVEAFYPDEDARHAFDALDEHYGSVLDATCQKLDPDNIILDFLQNSPYEPVLRNIIYKNGPLQEQLFARFGSRAIANATRVNLLNQLESQVKAFYAREQGAQPEQQAAPRTAQNGAATQQRRFTLPPKKDAPAATATAPVATQPAVPAQAVAPAPAPAPAPAQPTMSSGVTGSLTRGNEGGGAIDESAEANALFRKMFGS
jgi:hypothetical protein